MKALEYRTNITNHLFLFTFDGAKARSYDTECNGSYEDMGFACETDQYYSNWYRSAVLGKRDYWRGGFTEIEWAEDGAFKIVKPSCIVAETTI